ncbi:MAG: universal stress protein [Desulfovibrionaceae bacterium]|nr:universal stress protein [Desulfovibrionaceae bacterium]
MGYQKVLVPVSGKYQLKRAAQTLEQALLIVREDGEICFLHCVEEVPCLISGDAHKKLVMENAGEAEKLLQPLTDRVKMAGIAHSVHILEGAPAMLIPRFASEAACNVVAMFSDGRNTLGKLFTGSVTERVLQKLSVPLLVVHPYAA